MDSRSVRSFMAAQFTLAGRPGCLRQVNVGLGIEQTQTKTTQIVRALVQRVLAVPYLDKLISILNVLGQSQRAEAGNWPTPSLLAVALMAQPIDDFQPLNPRQRLLSG